MSHKLVKIWMALRASLVLPLPCLPALGMPLALKMVTALLWHVLVMVVSVGFLGWQLMAGLQPLVGGLVGLLAEAAAGGLIGVLVGVPEMGHLKVGVLAGVLLGLQRMNKGPVRVCLLLHQLPLRLMAEQVLLMRLTICLVLSLMIHKLRRQLLPELLPMKVHVWSLLLWEMPWLLLRL